MPSYLRYVTFAVAAVLLAGCRPPPLTEPPPDIAPPDSIEPDTVTRDGETEDGDVSTPPFSEVTTVIGNNCAKANCHGNPSLDASDFKVGSNNPSASEVRSSLEGVTLDDPMAPMVAPDDPPNSGLYQAIKGLQGRTEMPPGDSLAAADIETIRAWIAGGAPYE